MSIVDKLTYLNTTKQLLKTEINKINNVLTDESTFRSYPQELFNGYLDVLNNGTDTLWNNLEKVSASGEEATLENVENAPIKMVLNGNTSQETTTGKNLFDVPEEYVVTSSISNIPTNIEVGRYIISVDNIITDGTADSSSIIFYYEDGTQYATIYLNNTNKSRTLNFTKKVTKYNIYSQNSWAASQGVTATFYKLMIRSQSITDDSYEPYTGGQPSPSPDYPQQVKVVKGENVVSVQGKNLLDTSNARNDKTWLTRNSDGSLTLNYPSGSNVNFTDLFENNINMPTDNYILKIFMEGTFVGGNLIVKNTNGNYIGQTPIRNGNAITITNSDIGNIQFYVVSAGTNCTIKLELEKGTPTSYVPYSKTDYPINLGDIELCKINTYKDYFHKDSGKWYEHKEIGKYVFNGSESWSRSSTRQSTEYFRFRTSALQDVVLAPSSSSVLMSAYCDLFVIQTAADTYKRIEGISAISNGQMDIYYEPLKEYTAPEFKTWLSNNNVTLYYVLATPTETEITNTTLIEQLEAISKAKSVKDKTYITQTNEELPFILDVEAIKEYEVN